MFDKIIKNNANTKRDIIVVSIIYFLSQGFLVVLTGTWWDEKNWFFSTYQQMWDISLQLGKPSSYFIFSFLTIIPELCGRVLIFILFYLSALGVYIIFNQIPFISSQDVLLITALYVIIPINDARALLGVFPYSLGFFLYILGFCLLIILQEKYEYRNFLLRMATLVIFFCSFTLNSNLVFYALVLLYILAFLIEGKKIHSFYKFLDFLIIPFVYFIFKNACFPAHGIYEGYNEVTLEKIVHNIFLTFFECVSAIKNIFSLWGRYILFASLCSFIFLGIYILERKRINNLGVSVKENKGNLPILYRIVLLVMGVMTLYLGIFPYKILDLSNRYTGVSGRSSILIGVGAAISIYALILWVPYEYCRIWMCSLLIICGICHFNYFYLLYQQDYYRQMDIIYELKENKDVLYHKKNILYLSDYEPEISTTRFYTLNSNAAIAFGDQSHFIMHGVKDLVYLENEERMYKFVNEGDYQMKDYEIGKSNEVDAIISYHDCIGLDETLYLKFLELTDHEKFEKILYKKKNFDVFVPGTEQYEDIYNSIHSEFKRDN